ncbi:MAG: hypothetical protein QM639_13970 [Rhodocyclaceae bacterium]
MLETFTRSGREDMQNYYQQAFGEFDPQNDEFVAVKFALSVLVMDGRFGELADLLTDGHAIGALEGVPGWSLERRDSGPSSDMPGYADWPVGKSFRAYVNPNEFTLNRPEIFMDTEAFHSYVRKILAASTPSNCPLPDELMRIRSLIV